jgi:ABC-type oligopeptide transport system substrate-binding subunit
LSANFFYSAQSRLDYDLSASSWVGDYNDPNILDLFVGSNGNRTGWKNAQYDRLISEANREPNRIAERSCLSSGNHLIAEGAPVVPVYFYRLPVATMIKDKGICRTCLTSTPCRIFGSHPIHG